jgi:hypothetical protein
MQRVAIFKPLAKDAQEQRWTGGVHVVVAIKKDKPEFWVAATRRDKAVAAAPQVRRLTAEQYTKFNLRRIFQAERCLSLS